MSLSIRNLTSVATIAAAALVLAGCSGGQTTASAGGASAGASEVTELKVGVTPIANAANLYIAIEQGYFTEEGLDVTPTIIQTASTAIPSLLNDELQLALMTSVPTVTAASKGLPISVVSGSDRYPVDGAADTTALVVAPESGISSLADVAGKTVALVGLKSAPDLALRVVLEEAGVDPSDVEMVEIAYPDMVSALQSNRVDAAFVVDPFLSAAKAAGLDIVSQPFTEGLGGMNALLWVGSDAFVQANPETAGKFASAIKKAGEFANENPEAVREVLPEFTSLSPEAIAKSVIPTWDGEISDADVQAYVDLMKREGFIAADAPGVEDLLWAPSGN